MTQFNEPVPGQPEPAGYAYQVQPTHSYGQPQSGAYGYPAMPAPLPAAPTMNVAYPRPGGVLAAAVLAYIQAGITTIAFITLMSALFEGAASTVPLLVEVLVVLTTGVGVGLLIAGGVRLAAGRDRVLMVVACVVQFALCLYYIILFATMTDDDLGSTNPPPEVDGLVGFARGVLVMLAIFFAVMPTISLALTQSRATTGFLRSRNV